MKKNTELFVNDILEKMTLEEKIGQLNQEAGFVEATGPKGLVEIDILDEEDKISRIKSGSVGSILNMTGVAEIEKIQRLAVEESRLGIPLLFGYDVIHGYQTIFPLPLAEACSWDLDLAKKTASLAAVETAAAGINWTFAPMVDVSREPRWGRVMEGAGEDPFLGSAFGVARIKGFQGNDLSDPGTILACVKHLAAYGWNQAGRDYTHAEIDDVTLHNMVLPPFKAAIQDGGVLSVMNAFNVRNGIPATADSYLQRELLKGLWGFDGFVVSDWRSVYEMIPHGFARDLCHSAECAIKAGSDMDMESLAYHKCLKQLVESGQVDIELVDDAVKRILTVKYLLGLFDDPYKYLNQEREKRLLSDESHMEVALESAERSIVLLKNKDSILPLGKTDSIGVIGSLAEDKDTPLGNWRAQAKKESAVSLIEGLQQNGFDFQYQKGVDIAMNEQKMPVEVVVNHADRSQFDAAIKLASEVDKIIFVAGEVAMQSGEARSRTCLDFPGLQQELLEAVYAVNPNIVLVVMSGRPLVLTWADKYLPAILQAWHLGSQSGNAIANVLSGEYNPSAKLVMSFPRSTGQVPIYYNQLNTGRPDARPDVWWSHYIDESNDPLYPFGHGLNYSSFEYSDLVISVFEDTVSVSVLVENISDRAGEEVVQLYIWDRVASVARPIRELKGFKKMKFEAKQSQLVEFSLGQAELGFYDQHGNYIVEPGLFEVTVSGSSEGGLKGEFEWLN